MNKHKLKKIEDKVALSSKGKDIDTIIIYIITKENSYFIPEGLISKIGLDPTPLLNRTFLGNSNYKKVGIELISEELLNKIGKYTLITFV